MHYAGRRRSETNPLASIPLFRPAALVLHRPEPLSVAPPPGYREPHQPLTDQALREREMANAEAGLREAVRVYDAARAEIGDANRTHTVPIVSNGHVVMPARRLSAERMHQRKSYAFRLFNKRRSQLAAARRRVEAARAALDQPSLAFIEERAAVAAEMRASKRVPIHPIASAATA